MNFSSLLQAYIDDDQLVGLASQLKLENGQRFQLKNLAGSSPALAVWSVRKNTQLPQLIICNDKEQAAYFMNDLEEFVDREKVLFYPGSYRRPYQIEETDNANIRLRAEVLNRLTQGNKPFLLVSYPDALFEKVITRKELKSHTIGIKNGDKLSLDFLNESMQAFHFERVDFVAEPGQFAIRGGIIDIFSFSHESPYRIDLFGDEVENIRSFDVVTQRSIETHSRIQIVPNIEIKHENEHRISFFDYLPDKVQVWFQSFDIAKDRLNKHYEKAEQLYSEQSEQIRHLHPSELFIDSKGLEAGIQRFNTVAFGMGNASIAKAEIKFNTEVQPAFNKHFNLLSDTLNKYTEKGYTNILLCNNEKQKLRFDSIFQDIGVSVKFHGIVSQLHEGFIDHEKKLLVFTDHQIFERYQKFRLKDGYKKKEALDLKELSSLQPGDYVTHIDHGVGKFAGLQKIDVNGKKQEAMKLVYRDNDVLYISIHSLHKISKYSGKEGFEPKTNKLGSGAWAKTKQKTKKRIREIAYDLIGLYAKRKAAKGFAFAPDSYLQHELEASFIYEDTPDQEKATEAVKRDMEADYPMDRLICGDVGFGKTEIAIRAAFKAVADGKQVAILVPTTILAMQHYNTFKSRLGDLACEVDYINRFKTKKQTDDVLKRLKEGKLDIIIGTHKLVGKGVEFKDLGLLIIDEEQKFGVAVKDKLKTLKVNLDTLTLSATPIPRTLQFSLLGARDLSVINTPPPNRFPVETHVRPFNEEVIRDAVSYELQRGGQVFVVNNRVENIQEVAGMIQRLVPDAKVAIGHGQMEGRKLEAIMLDFMAGEYDVLVATTIIESGLDVPNANTIIINNAHHFGMSDLHQMRGRVGRSNKKAFAFLLAPDYASLTEDARKRLMALEQYSELGSGFNISMKDLEIRGAGDMLGGEQSGFINEMGFDTYQKILAETIDELKENDFSELFKDEAKTKNPFLSKDLQLDTDLEILIPDNYVNAITERLQLYQELNSVKDDQGLAEFELSMIDRFGPLPDEVEELMNSIRLKWLAMELGFEKMILKNQRLICYFPQNQEKYFMSEAFGKVLEFVKIEPNRCKLKDKGDKLILSMSKVPNVREGIKLLQKLHQTEPAQV